MLRTLLKHPALNCFALVPVCTGLAGFTAGKEFHLALKINYEYFNRKSNLVNTIKNDYNTSMANEISKQAHKKLLAKGKTIAVAESCSGGLLSCLLTELPGSSKYFISGVVAYSNSSKEKFLNIPAKIIAKYKAVSKNVALLMAENIRKKSKSDFALSLTGIAGPVASPQSIISRCNGAGPLGATKNKPVGTVFICLSFKNKNICRKLSLQGSRQLIRKQSAYYALRLLCAHL